MIIDDLLRKHQGERTRVIYFYSDFTRQKMYTTVHMYSSLLKQLVSGLHPLPQSFMIFFGNHQRRADKFASPRLEDLLEEFSRVAQLFEEVFVVIDALDEHSTTYREEFFHTLSVYGPSVRVFITSRPEYDITGRLDGYPHITLEPSRHGRDIEAFIKTYVQRSRLAILLSSKAEEEIITRICHKSGGL